jgi:hypothetical protein
MMKRPGAEGTTMSDESKKTREGDPTADPAAWDDPDAPPTPEELEAAARLRDALDAPGFRFEHASEGAEDADADLARALHLAAAPRAIEAAEHREILDRALGSESRGSRVVARRKATVAAIYAVVAAAAAVLVALFAIRLAPHASEGASAPARTLAVPRSTEPLFDAPFPKEERTSARVDRIARARDRDLRQNRYARWGVP